MVGAHCNVPLHLNASLKPAERRKVLIKQQFQKILLERLQVTPIRFRFTPLVPPFPSAVFPSMLLGHETCIPSPWFPTAVLLKILLLMPSSNPSPLLSLVILLLMMQPEPHTIPCLQLPEAMQLVTILSPTEIPSRLLVTAIIPSTRLFNPPLANPKLKRLIVPLRTTS